MRRDDADAVSMDLINRIINAIKADPNEGEDGEVYSALGYVRKGQRANGRLRNRSTAGEAQPSESPAAAKEGARDKKAA